MTWPWVNTTITVLYYILLPIITILSWLLLPLIPLLHLFRYTFHALYLPLRFLAKFESLYIYFTTAALIGLLSGTILHYISRLLHTFIETSFRTRKTKLPLENETSQHKLPRKKSWHEESESRNMKPRSLPPRKGDIERAHRDYWESASDRRRGKGGLLAREEIILEEEDSDELF